MGTVTEMDEKLNRTLRDGRKLLEKLKSKSAELMLTRQTLPLDQHQTREDLLDLCNQVADYINRLKADMRQAELISQKIEGHVMWKRAVRDLFGDAGLTQCYEHMKKQEADRIRTWTAPELPPVTRD